MPEPQQQSLAVLVAWLDALRRSDLDAVRELLDPDVVWRGIPVDAICHNRDDVLDTLAGQLHEGLPRVSALELIAGDGTAVLGVRSDELRQIGDVPLAGQVFNVFQVRDGGIVAIQDYRDRDTALNAAAAGKPNWT